jgi:hypothetical protein
MCLTNCIHTTKKTKPKGVATLARSGYPWRQDKHHTQTKEDAVVIFEMNKINGSWSGQYDGPTRYGPRQQIMVTLAALPDGSATMAVSWIGQHIERKYQNIGVAILAARNRLSLILGTADKPDLGVRFAFAREPGAYLVDTSQEAADLIKEKAPKLRERVYQYIRSKGAKGATADEVQVDLNLTHQTGAPRVTELARMGRIVRTDEKRKTRYGRNAGVYVSDVYSAEAEALAQDTQNEDERLQDMQDLSFLFRGGKDDE